MKSSAPRTLSRAFLSDSRRRRPRATPMLLLKQLEFAFERSTIDQRAGRDVDLELKTREILHGLGLARLARLVRVEWNSRLQTAAGRADFREKLISLNPRLCDYDESEIDRTLRHELAHLLAQFRAGRHRVSPHGPEWRDACCDLGIGDEVRCHNLPFLIRERARRFIYKCPNCAREFPRVRRIRRAVACLACCRVHNGGEFDAPLPLQLMTAAS